MDKFFRKTPVEALRCDDGDWWEDHPRRRDDAAFRANHVPACPECEGEGFTAQPTGAAHGGVQELVDDACPQCSGSGRSTWEEYDSRRVPPTDPADIDNDEDLNTKESP